MTLPSGIKIEIVDHTTSEKEYDMMQKEMNLMTCSERRAKGLPCYGSPSTCMYGVDAFDRPVVCRAELGR